MRILYHFCWPYIWTFWYSKGTELFGPLKKHKTRYPIRSQKLKNKKSAFKKSLILTCHTVFVLISTDFVRFGCDFTWFIMMYRIKFYVYDADSCKIAASTDKMYVWQAEINDFLMYFPVLRFVSPQGISVFLLFKRS